MTTENQQAARSTDMFFGHPRGLSTLFFTEMWERFSYYGMRAILILFMTAPLANGGLGFDVATAGAVYGLYTGFVYLACLPGGWIADRFWGQRKATFVGGVIIMFGHIALAIPSLTTFYLGLALLVIGTGLLKPNISTMVGQLYCESDRRRDAGYSIYYMGINIGAFLSPLVCGWLAQAAGFRLQLAEWGLDPADAWHFGFGAAAIGMAAGLIHYQRGARHLGDAGLSVTPVDSASRRQLTQASLALVGLVSVLGLLAMTGIVSVTAQQLNNMFGIILLVITVGFFMWLFTVADWSEEERKRLVLIVVLFLGATVFWSLYEQGGSTFNLFAERNTNTVVLGFDFPASWMQSLNPIYIICGLAPGFAWLWMKLGPREPSSPAKFAIGMLFMALGWGVMIGAAINARDGMLVSPLWLATMYLLLAMGEMCLSPVGLSAMSKLAPSRIAGLTMGVWFLASSIGSYLGARVAGLYETLSLVSIFTVLTGVALVATLLMSAMIKPMRERLAR